MRKNAVSLGAVRGYKSSLASDATGSGHSRLCASLPSPPAAPMLVLFDTPAGHALFRVKKPEKISASTDLHADFANPEAAGKMCDHHPPPQHSSMPWERRPVSDRDLSRALDFVCSQGLAQGLLQVCGHG